MRPVISPILVFLALMGAANAAEPVVQIGSKSFNESVILGELARQLVEDAGAETVHTRELGGSRVCWQALLAGEIDVYPDYTGTIREELLAGEDIASEEALARALAARGLRMTRPLGFNNTYAIGVRETAESPSDGSWTGTVLLVVGVLIGVVAFLVRPRWATVTGGVVGGTALVGGLVLTLASSTTPAVSQSIRTISDLADYPEFKAGFSNEFIDRSDGWRPLKSAYGLPHEDVVGLEHDLAYPGIESGSIQFTDLYATDAKMRRYGIRVLEDDKGFFPEYDAVYLYRADLEERAPEVVASLRRIEGRIDEATMVEMNARVVLEHEPEQVVAADFLSGTFGVTPDVDVETRIERLWRYTRQHFFLVSVSVLLAIVVAIPLGVVAAKWKLGVHAIVSVVGILQTIPSLALFVVMIPLLGLGAEPAIFALFLYSLLPIVRNTHAGLTDIPRGIHESAEAIGLPPFVRLRLVELPLAARSILAGIKTAVVINVGTATLGGFIGAGGYGEPIFAGIRHARNDRLLEGAIPAALMALAAQGLFELAERWVVPHGLRLKSRE